MRRRSGHIGEIMSTLASSETKQYLAIKTDVNTELSTLKHQFLHSFLAAGPVCTLISGGMGPG